MEYGLDITCHFLGVAVYSEPFMQAARTHLVVIYQLTCAAGRMVFVMQVYDGVTGLFHLFFFLLSIAAVELNTVIAFTLYRIVGIYGVSCCA